MKIHTTVSDVEGLLLSSGKFIALKNFNVTLNVQDLSVATKNGKADLSSLSPEDRAEFYDYMICRWIAAKETDARNRWASVADHS